MGRDCEASTDWQNDWQRDRTPGQYSGTRAVLRRSVYLRRSAAFINTAMIRNLRFQRSLSGGHPSDCAGRTARVGGQHASGREKFARQHDRGLRDFCASERCPTLSRRGWDPGHAIGIATAAGVCNSAAAPGDAVATPSALPRLRTCRLRVHALGESLRRGKCRDGIRRVMDVCRIARG